MITRLTLQNFGPFDVQSIELAPLTLLAGYNYTGKSTILRAIEGLSTWDIDTQDMYMMDYMKRRTAGDKSSVRLDCIVMGESISLALNYKDDEPIPYQLSTINTGNFPKADIRTPGRNSKLDKFWCSTYLKDYKGILLLDQPEAFLHQREQTLLGKALADKVAGGGIQIIVESHSEHIFNGIRIAIKQGMLTPDKFMAFNFSRNDVGISHTEKVTVEKDGGCDNWPNGFFGQSDTDYQELFGF